MVKDFLSKWYIWIFPAMGLAISAWLLIQFVSQQGPQIQIHFDDATFIAEGKTMVRYRGVEVGSVEDVELDEDDKGVIVKVTLKKKAKHLAVEGTRFWIETPEVGIQGVSGIDTIIKGASISLLIF